MSIPNFNGETWLAFSDLCGTKAMYKENPDKAAKALDHFYNTVYNVVQGVQNEISALAVSDCAIFWVHDDAEHRGMFQMLPTLLKQLKWLHRQMIEHNYLIRTTIAYGHFRYEQRIEIRRLRKNMFIGGGYLEAYAANDKVTPGGIVILRPPAQGEDDTRGPGETLDVQRTAGDFAAYLRARRGQKQWEFVWWINTESDVDSALQSRKKLKKQSVYQALTAFYNSSLQGGRDHVRNEC